MEISRKGEGGREEKREQGSEYQVSEGRWGDKQWRTYIGISRKGVRGREQKSNSRDLSNRF